MFKLVFASASALALAAVPALAQDAPNTFNGPFIGAQAGWQQDRQTLQVGNIEASTSNDGFAYGGQIGYDFRAGSSAVVGVEAALTGRSGTAEFDDFDLSAGRTFSATVRAGYLVSPSGLLYARGGYSNARFSVDDGLTRESTNRDGFTVGAGYEQMLATNISARLEYNYSGFGTEDVTDLVGTPSELKFNRHAVTGGLNFRF